jgi:glycosyltransferase involved in cell wall biosynthesis
MPYTVDNERFITSAALSPQERESVRARFGLPLNKPVVLYAAKFIRRKHPDDVIRAAALLKERGYDFTVLMVGGGEMDKELHALTEILGLENVVFGGFVNQAELPRVYAASDVFVLPSESESFGLTVNEVMCAGVPVVLSDEVGCGADLVKDGFNGYKIKAGSFDSLADAVDKLLAAPERRAEMGRRSLEIISSWSYEQCRIGLLKALSATVRGPRESRA